MAKPLTLRVVAAVFTVALIGAACTDEGEVAQTPTPGDNQTEPAPDGQQQSTLDEVTSRGILRCGVNESVPGFGFLTPEGTIEGFDIDFCKGIAAAVFGEPDPQEGTHFDLISVSVTERFNALRARNFDVLTRNATWTSSRDGGEGLAFAHVNYYDGQGMMVKADSGFQSVADMDGTQICVLQGTTTELNLIDYAQEQGVDLRPLTFEENAQIQEAFIADQCDGWTSDRSQLAGNRSEFPDDAGGPDSLVILEDVMSKEPLAPAVLDGDSRWLDVVNWVVNGVILAEELGVTSQNVEQEASSPSNARIAALLGVAFEGGEVSDPGLGISGDFMQHVLRAVGNYGEMYDRHLTPLGLDRGVNALWIDGGIQYAMPFR